MNCENTGDFIRLLESAGELIRIKAPVSAHLEIAAITDRVAKSPGGGKALLFENVLNSPFPVLTNAFGGMERLRLALGGEKPDEIGARLKDFIEPPLSRVFKDKIGLLKKLFAASRFFPRRFKTDRPPCREVTLLNGEVDLTALPVLHSWPGDGGPFITLPVVITKDPATGKRNVGMYRLQVFDRNTTGMHWHVHKDGAGIFREHARTGRRIEAAVAIGGDPALTYAATAPMPRGMDEMLLAGFIRRRPIKLVPALTVALDVPAEADIILEGYIDPSEKRLEGPFGDHTGYYSPADYYPVFHVTAMTHRKDAVYSATVVGRPPMEDCYLGYATERIFLPLLRTVLPEIRDIRLPWEGVFHNLALVAIEKEYPGQARKVMQGLWGSGQMSFTKAVVVLDGDAPLYDDGAVLDRLLSHPELPRDIIIAEGVLDVLDHAAPQALFGGKIGIDATDRIAGEPPRPAPNTEARHFQAAEALEGIKALDAGFGEGRIFSAGSGMPVFILPIAKTGEKNSAHFRRLLGEASLPVPAVIILYDAAEDIHNNGLLLWRMLNNVDPRRDMEITGDRVIIDATQKGAADGHVRPWPADAESDAATKARVAERLEELGLARLFK